MQHAGLKLRFASTVLVTGPKVHYAEQGHPDGEAIVLVHGWPDSWCSFSPVLACCPPATMPSPLTSNVHTSTADPTDTCEVSAISGELLLRG